MATTTATPIKTTCPYCGVGCGVLATAGKDYRSQIQGDPDHPANFGTLCSKGSALGDTTNLQGRLLHASVNGKATTLNTALDTVAKKFQQTIAEHGLDSVAFYVSGQLLTEDYYVANKLMKGYIGSGNIDTNSRLCMSSAVAGHKRAFGGDIVPANYEDLAIADLVVMVGANTAWCHPIVFQRIKERREQKKLVVIDPRQTPTAEQADLHLPIKPGTDVMLFNGLLHWLLKHNAIDQDYIDQHTQNFATTAEKIATATLQQVSKICDLSIEQLTTFYTWFSKTSRTVTLFSQGVNQSSAGTDKVNAIINCHLATGRVGKPGSSPFSITGQPNAMGGREVGGLANMLAAHMGFTPEHTKLVQTFWQSPAIAIQPGLKAVDLFNAVDTGKIKAIWIMGTNPAVSMPNAGLVNRALGNCEFVVVSDCMADTDTTRHANVLLPATGWGEKDGTVTNSERRISRQRAFLPPAGEAQHDWWLITQVAQRMGFGDAFAYQSAHEIFVEHAQLSAYKNNGSRAFNLNGYAHLSQAEYNALTPQQWPIIGKAGNERILGDGRFFTASGQAQFVPVSYQAPRHAPCNEYPLILNTGRLRDHWHTMTRTGKSAKLASHRTEPTVSIHPNDAVAANLTDHSIARIHSRWGAVYARVNISPQQRAGEIFMPIHWNDQFATQAVIGKVVNPVVDAESGEPEFKHTPVAISPFTANSYAFWLSREDITEFAELAEYGVKVTGNQFTRYELVSAKTPAALAAQFTAQQSNCEHELLEYTDQASGTIRLAVIHQQQLQQVIFVSAAPITLERSWLSSLFSQPDINPQARQTLLLGESPDPNADVGPIVCSCFGVGRNTIQQAIKQQHLSSVAAVGQCLKAGTNCGSCQSEIAEFLAN